MALVSTFVAAFDGYHIIAGVDVGVPEPSAADALVTRAFESDDLEDLLLVSVGSYDTATEAKSELGAYSRGFMESTSSSNGPVADGSGEVRFDGVAPGVSVETLEASLGRYVVAAVVVIRDGSTGPDGGESVLRAAVDAQSARIPERCLNDLVVGTVDDPTSGAEMVGRLAGLAIIVGGTIWAARVFVVRARRSAPGEKWAP